MVTNTNVSSLFLANVDYILRMTNIIMIININMLAILILNINNHNQ